MRSKSRVASIWSWAHRLIPILKIKCAIGISSKREGEASVADPPCRRLAVARWAEPRLAGKLALPRSLLINGMRISICQDQSYNWAFLPRRRWKASRSVQTNRRNKFSLRDACALFVGQEGRAGRTGNDHCIRMMQRQVMKRADFPFPSPCVRLE